MDDRFMNSFAAGVIGNVPALIIDKAASLLKLEQADFMDFAAALAFQGKIDSVAKGVFTLWIQMIFAGFLGVALIYAMEKATLRYYYIKGMLFGSLTWFAVYAIDIFFQIPKLVPIDFAVAVSHYLAAVAWGLGTAWAFRRLDQPVR